MVNIIVIIQGKFSQQTQPNQVVLKLHETKYTLFQGGGGKGFKNNGIDMTDELKTNTKTRRHW